MKRKQSLASILLAGALLTGVAVSVALPTTSVYAAETTQTASATGVINVSGNGKITVKPDIAYVSIGVETTATTAAKAQAETAQKMSKLNTLLKNTWSISQADIQTVQFYVQPNYNYNDKDGQKVTGYTAYHTLQVSYRNLDKLGQLLDDASKAGANNLGSVSFGIENPQTYQDQVMSKAVNDAASKASAIAKAANRTLGELLSISEQGTSTPPVVLEQAMTAKSSSADAGTSIEPGTVELDATLNVQYAMK
ncbi:SIMPL domain-containing protein [Paenibacillus kandeliae]|uniref:SIMPL domain-containing protein n=1 Tax=Paenibacillus kandeliae TaxID=3231269 RepID=UPI00345776E6